MVREMPSLRPQQGPPTAGLALGVLWKYVEYAQGVDFLLSINNSNVATILEFVIGPGGWVFVLFCAAWLAQSFIAPGPPSMKRASPAVTAIVAAIPAFALGAMVTARFSNQAMVIARWEVRDNACHATIDTRLLQKYKESYRVHLICGATDSSVDHTTDNQIQISGPFTIANGAIAISSPIQASLLPWFSKHGQIWQRVALIPEGRDLVLIRSLRDIENNKGIVLQQITAGGSNTIRR